MWVEPLRYLPERINCLFLLWKMGHKIPEFPNISIKGRKGHPQGKMVPRGQVQKVTNLLEVVHVVIDSMLYMLGKRLRRLPMLSPVC